MNSCSITQQANKFISAESTTVTLISGEDRCFKSINAVAVGSGGPGMACGFDRGSGGGSGFINSTEFVRLTNTNISVTVEVHLYHNRTSSLTMIDTGETLLSAANGLSHHCGDGGAGSSDSGFQRSYVDLIP